MDPVLIEGPEEAVRMMGAVWRAVFAEDTPDEIRMHPQDFSDLRLFKRNGVFVLDQRADGSYIDRVRIQPDESVAVGTPIRVHAL